MTRKLYQQKTEFNEYESWRKREMKEKIVFVLLKEYKVAAKN